MKGCVQCGRQLPESATECVFCGTAQPVQESSKTFIEFSQDRPAPRPSAPPFPSPPTPAPPAGAQSTTMMVPAVGAQPPQGFGPPPAQPAPRPATPPPAGPDDNATMLAKGPLPGGPPPKQTPAWGVAAPPPMADVGPPSWVGVPQSEDVPAESFTGRAPGSVDRPPFLASESADRAYVPIDPWFYTLRILGICCGLMLLVAFLAPWSIGDQGTIFSFTEFGAKTWEQKVFALSLGAVGLLSICFAALPLATPSRGLLLAILALGTLGFNFWSASEREFLGMPLYSGHPLALAAAGFAGHFVAPVGLLLRSQYRDTISGRLLATIGALCVIALYCVPVDGTLPVEALIESLTKADSALQVVAIIDLFVPLLLAVLTLLVWIPPPHSAGGATISWGWILYPLIGAVLYIAFDDSMSLSTLGPSILFPLAAVATRALAAYGLAAVFGKGLEKHSRRI